jgi:lipopolysaccharide/colanic/teichoic acid biosynthesis glycosyltransferase
MLHSLIKRLFDILLSLPVMVVLLPVFVIIIIAIKLSGKGPVIFKQTRAGKNGKPFVFYKFRTMKVDTDPFGASPKSGTDPRLTRTGVFLREYSLDELPQLFNILKGDMSFVGPRPLYMEQMAEWNSEQKKRLLVKPGLTGLAQISGRGEITREEKLTLDVEYVRNISLLLDFKIMFKTFMQALTRKSIYEKKYSQTEETRRQSDKGNFNLER